MAQAAQVDYYHERLLDAIEKAKQVLAIPLDELKLANECDARYIYCMSSHGIGEPPGQQELTSFITVSERLGNRLWLHFALWQLEYTARFRGDWAAARQFGQQGMAVAPGGPTLLSTVQQTEAETGEFDRAEELLQVLMTPMVENPVNPTFHYSAAVMVTGQNSWIAGVPREPALPHRYTDFVLSSPFAIPLFASVTDIGRALDAPTTGNLDTCQSAYKALERLRGQFISVMAIDRLLGHLPLATGNVPRTVGHFDDSLAFCAKAGFRPDTAWTCWGLAAALLERTGDGDRRRAEELLEERAPDRD